MLLPEEARSRQLDYCLPVLVDVRHHVYNMGAKSPPGGTSSNVENVKNTSVGSEQSSRPGVVSPAVLEYTLVQDHLYREVPFCEIPIMLQTRHCHLFGTSRIPSNGHGWDGSTEKRPQSECPYDEGGYFIIRGIERNLQVQEGLRTNVPVVFPVKQPNKYSFMCEVRSRHELKMRSTSTLRVYITTRKGGSTPEIFVSMPFLPTLDIPLIMVFRLLHQDDHEKLIALIVPDGVESTDGGSSARSGTPSRLFQVARAVLTHTSNRMSIDEVYEYIGREGTRENTLESRKRYVSHLIANELLPHLGYSDTKLLDVSSKKAVYLCIIVRRLIRAYCNTPASFSGSEEEGRGIAEVDDRDHYANKRFALCGTMIALLFRQLMRQFVKNLRRYMYITIENRRYLNIADAVNNRKISAALRFAFRTGNWSTQRSSGTHVGVTQVIHRMSHIALQSQIRRVNTPVCREGKATHIRQAHVSHWGVLCPSETPEGSGCGLVKNLAVLTHVRIGTPSYLITNILMQYLEVTPLQDARIESLQHCLVFVNGDIVGVHPNPKELVRCARLARRAFNLPFDTSVVTLPYGVMLHSDTGCCLRPLFIVENLSRLDSALELWRNCPGYELWNILVQKGIIEYVDKDEEKELRVAVTLSELLDEEGAGSEVGGGGVRPNGERVQRYSHLEIHPTSILGHCANQIPFADRNQAPRNIYQASMGKQAVALPSMAFNSRLDAQMHVPYYTQKPLAQTGSEISDFSMGTNAIVAIMMYTGNNQEDSLIMNKAFVDRGGFRSSYYTVFSAEERSVGADTECFENPVNATAACIGQKQADYTKLDSMGTVGVGHVVGNGTAVIGKTMSTPKFHTGRRVTVKRDRSIIFEGVEDERCTVDQVMITSNREGKTAQRVRMRTTRTPMVGDKFSSRHGQKGTVGILLPQEDMPFSMATGMTPDIIVNPCAIPSRMTIAHLVECIASKTGAILGKFADGMAFRKVSVESISEALHSSGYQRHGNEKMINGMTGEAIEALIFMGPTFYQKLKHMTNDKVHSRTTGPRTIMTRQPVEGRARKGGLRIGEMERDCFVAYGASKVIMERLLYASDAFEVPMCSLCGQLAENRHNPEFGATVRGVKPYCRSCRTHDVETIVAPYPYKLLLQELGAIGITVKHTFDQPEAGSGVFSGTRVSERVRTESGDAADEESISKSCDDTDSDDDKNGVVENDAEADEVVERGDDGDGFSEEELLGRGQKRSRCTI
jgi:DNA-directed RNA polymerase II subunit RPB2